MYESPNSSKRIFCRIKVATCNKENRKKDLNSIHKQHYSQFNLLTVKKLFFVYWQMFIFIQALYKVHVFPLSIRYLYDILSSKEKYLHVSKKINV